MSLEEGRAREKGKGPKAEKLKSKPMAEMQEFSAADRPLPSTGTVQYSAWRVVLEELF